MFLLSIPNCNSLHVTITELLYLLLFKSFFWRFSQAVEMGVFVKITHAVFAKQDITEMRGIALIAIRDVCFVKTKVIAQCV
jgi:hypothetical protein